MRALLALALAACLEPRLVPCGVSSCPAGTTCLAAEGPAPAICATVDQLEACAGAADGASCSLGGGVGHCDRGACIPSGCGNGVVDPGEACDDNNSVSGDGCRADCKKLEACGDAMVDDGEGCDDGNGNPADGCDACVPTTWRASVVIGGNKSATEVGLRSPRNIAIDRRGNVYIADYFIDRILRVDPSGVVTAVAGTGRQGFSGDGGPATSAAIFGAAGVVVDGLGNLYFADGGNARVRRVDPAGTITTLAGTGTCGSAGDGGPATSAELCGPAGLAIDGLGNLYVADAATSRIRRIDLDGVITTVAGTGTAGFSGDGGLATAAQLNFPLGVALDRDGNLYVAEDGNQRIRKIDTAGVITTIAGTGTAGSAGDGGPATAAELYLPRGVAADGGGQIYIADGYGLHRIDAAGIITTIAGGVVSGATDDVEVDALGNLYVATTETYRVVRIDPAGTATTIAGTGSIPAVGDGGAAVSASLERPNGVACDGSGNFYIADTDENRIRKVDASGTMTTIAGNGLPGFSGDGGAAKTAGLQGPYGVTVDAAGNIYIADTFNHRIRRVDPSGAITSVAGGAEGLAGDGGPAISAQLDYPSGIAVDTHGNVFIADTDNARIRRIDPTGTITTFAGTDDGFAGDGGQATAARLSFPQGVAVDVAGNVYIADTVNNRIRRVAPSGLITTIAGNGIDGSSGDGGPAIGAELSAPYGVAVDAAGVLYIAEMDGDRIRRVDPGGTISTIAGTGIRADIAGDGAAAIDAPLGSPTSVAVDPLGRVYIAASYQNAIRRVDAAGTITTVAGAIDPLGMGSLARGALADPQAVVVAPPLVWVAGGATGTVQRARTDRAWLEVVAGRYPEPTAIGMLARYRGAGFSAIAGIAYDATAGRVYITERADHRISVVTIVDADDPMTWTIAPLVNSSGIAGFADGAVATARLRQPTGLYLDGATHRLYVADTGNHVVRAIDLVAGTTSTIAGVPATRGYFGDGSAATSALLYAPRAVTRCATGDLYIADTGNHRVRRIDAATGAITTVLGDGVAASSGEGRPATTFPVDAPLGLACDANGNLLVTSTTTVRLVTANASGVADGTGEVQTIYGAPPANTFPASVTRCLTGLAIVDPATVWITDSCSGLLVALHREPR